jgi:hypothetical protein
MHPPRARETTLAGRPDTKHYAASLTAEARHGVRGAADIDRLVGNAVAACACNEAASLIFNDADHQRTVHLKHPALALADLFPTSPCRPVSRTTGPADHRHQGRHATQTRTTQHQASPSAGCGYPASAHRPPGRGIDPDAIPGSAHQGRSNRGSRQADDRSRLHIARHPPPKLCFENIFRNAG